MYLNFAYMSSARVNLRVTTLGFRQYSTKQYSLRKYQDPTLLTSMSNQCSYMAQNVGELHKVT